MSGPVTRACLLLLALSLSFPASASGVWVASFATVGMDDAESARARKQLDAELGAVAPLNPTMAIDDKACLNAPSCAAGAIERAEADVAVLVQLVRAGPVVQVSTRLLDHSGGVALRDEHVLEVDDLEAGRLLSAAFEQRLRALVPAEAPVDDAKKDVDGGALTTSNLPVLGIAGLATAGVGLALLVGGAAVASNSVPVLEDAGSSSKAKEEAAIFGGIGIGVAIAGGVVVLGGGVLAALGLWDPPEEAPLAQ